MISPEVLRRYTYFAGIGEEGLKQISMIAEEKSIPAGAGFLTRAIRPRTC